MQTLFSKIALTTLAAFLLAANPAKANDPQPVDASAKQATAAPSAVILNIAGDIGSAISATDSAPSAKQTASTTDPKDAKPVSDASKKLDLSTPYSDPNIHGGVTIGYESTFGKNCHQSGMFSEFELSKDFHLSDGSTVSIFVSTGRYSNGALFH